MFNRLFGRHEAPVNALPEVSHITLGRSVKLDPLAWRRFGDAARFKLDRDTLEIVAQGLIELTEGGFVHRFYTDDDIMFQAVSTDRDLGAAVGRPLGPLTGDKRGLPDSAVRRVSELPRVSEVKFHPR